MLILDVLLRYSTVTLLFVIALLAIRDGRNFRPSLYIVLATFSIAFMLLGTSRPDLRLPQPLHSIVRFGDVPNIVFIWWLGLAIFQDNFRLRWPHWAIFILYVGALLPSRFMELRGTGTLFPIVDYALDLISIGIMFHLAYVAIKGRADDLIEPRRRLRLYFVLALAFTTLVALIAENLLIADHEEFLDTFRCMIIFPLALWGILWLAEMHPEKITFKNPEVAEDNLPDIDPRDQLLMTELKTSMEDDKIYREAGLTIRVLAARLNTPEHRLRALINNGLGYRNFSTFLNHYRIEAIKTAFADPANSRTPVLTIALSHGYNSLAPFNRAFRESESMTPSGYRQKLNEDIKNTLDRQT